MFLLGAAFVAMRVISRRQMAAQEAQMLAQRRQNIAEYKTWQWIFGRNKSLRITDQSANKAPKTGKTSQD